MADFVRAVFVLTRFDLLFAQSLEAAFESQDGVIGRAVGNLGKFRREHLPRPDNPASVGPDPKFFVHGRPPPTCVGTANGLSRMENKLCLLLAQGVSPGPG